MNFVSLSSQTTQIFSSRNSPLFFFQRSWCIAQNTASGVTCDLGSGVCFSFFLNRSFHSPSLSRSPALRVQGFFFNSAQLMQYLLKPALVQTCVLTRAFNIVFTINLDIRSRHVKIFVLK